ncbi:synaptogenesis protein syg-2-like [Penaeus monodon]|uniref:synaptogenesis protein syg-2-like n=1 Tax=Penaeus monodon TaxID=6687 RepID=UPI0018A7C803|nr:synaptogenesis protein syg-2-like [Penaeus monodon]
MVSVSEGVKVCVRSGWVYQYVRLCSEVSFFVKKMHHDYDRSIKGHCFTSHSNTAPSSAAETSISRELTTPPPSSVVEVSSSTRPPFATPARGTACPPTPCRILGWSSGATVETVSGVPVPLECLANEARPPAVLTWSRDGSAITNGNVEERVEESSLVERRWDARSRLHLTPTPADDGRRFFCQAAHAALEAPLLAFVTLSVLYPPGKPTISGYSPGAALREGETLILTCRASGGKPSPWLVWRRGSRVLDDTSTTEDGGGVVNSLEIEVSAAEDGAVFECEVNSDLLEEQLRTNVTLTVHYPPSVVHIRGPSQVEDGAPIGLTCETDESRPPAVITWLIQGRTYNSEQTLVTRVSTGGWITTSDLTKYVMRSNQAREVTVQCEATNPSVHGTVTATKVILVTPRSFSPPAEPASPPVLLSDLQPPLPAGSLLPLACASHGGHPPPTIRIYKEATEVPTDLILEGNVTRAEGQVTLTAADNGALISCELVRPGSRSPLITTGKLSVQCNVSCFHVLFLSFLQCNALCFVSLCQCNVLCFLSLCQCNLLRFVTLCQCNVLCFVSHCQCNVLCFVSLLCILLRFDVLSLQCNVFCCFCLCSVNMLCLSL